MKFFRIYCQVFCVISLGSKTNICSVCFDKAMSFENVSWVFLIYSQRYRRNVLSNNFSLVKKVKQEKHNHKPRSISLYTLINSFGLIIFRSFGLISIAVRELSSLIDARIIVTYRWPAILWISWKKCLQWAPTHSVHNLNENTQQNLTGFSTVKYEVCACSWN